MMKQFITEMKALSDPNRVRIIVALQGGELCVCRLIEFLKLAPSTVSKHLAILKHAGLVEGRKDGRWMHYRLPDDKTSASWDILRWVIQSLNKSAEVKADQLRLQSILKTDIEELTRIYKK